MWDVVRDRIKGMTTDVALELPGHGPDPWIPRATDFDGIVDEYVSRVPLEAPAWWVGYSMGARVVLALAVRHPEKMAGAILIGAHPGLQTESERVARIEWETRHAESIVRNGVERFAKEWEALPLFASQNTLPEHVRKKQYLERCTNTSHGLAWAIRALGLGNMPSLWEDLPRVERPLYFITGERDEKFTELAKKSVTLVPRASHCVVPGVGHNVVLEAPEAVTTAVVQCILKE